VLVKASLTVKMTSCPSPCSSSLSQASGNLRIADIRIEAACEMPTGETSGSEGWWTTFPNQTQHKFRQTLSAGGSPNFSGRYITEVDPVSGGGAVDNCWFVGSSIPQITTAVTGGAWVVDPGNTYGIDTVGWNEPGANYYQQNAPTLPCSLFGPQLMSISCRSSSDQTPYSENELVDGIDSGTVSAKRQSNFQQRNWP
jgi:hypothetical protein